MWSNHKNYAVSAVDQSTT